MLFFFFGGVTECQDRRSRSETLYKKHDRRRPASLDLNNAIGNGNVSSPRLELGAMKKSTLCTRRSGSGCGNGNFPSPGTPNYLHATVAMQKGWSSERVPLHTSAARKQVGAALLPFNNGRTLPSKWEDAERWILSPVSGDGGTGRASFPAPQRRPKSKSGPLGPPGAAAVAYYSMYSPAVPLFEGANSRSFMAASPFSAAVSVPAAAADGLTASSGGSCGVLSTRTDPCMARSVSVHGCSQMHSQSSLPAQGCCYIVYYIPCLNLVLLWVLEKYDFVDSVFGSTFLSIGLTLSSKLHRVASTFSHDLM